MQLIRNFLQYLSYEINRMVDDDVERQMERISKPGYEPSLLRRFAEHPAGFVAILIFALFAAMGVAEVLCALVGAPFDARLG